MIHLENLGAEAFVHIRVDRMDLPLVARISPDRQMPEIGSSLELAFPESAVRVFDAAGKRIEAAAPARSERMREKALG